MANIMINDICNLNCPYCFANEFVNKSQNSNMTLESFEKAVNFILRDGIEKGLGIIGGEPTLHPKFDDFMKILIRDNRVQRIMIFTNGMFLDHHWDVCCHAKTHMLINCNPPKYIGKDNFRQLGDNLEELFERKLCTEQATLGVNIDSPDYEYDFILELLLRHNLKRLRVSVTVPNMDFERNTDAHQYFKTMKPIVMKFFRKLLNHGIIPNYDCNKIPPCLITEEERNYFDKRLQELGKRSNISERCVRCNPVIDIRQDLTAVRCFGLSQWSKLNIADFKGLADLKAYYVRQFDVYQHNTVYSPKCVNCYERKTCNCNGGCLAFKIKHILGAATFMDNHLFE